MTLLLLTATIAGWTAYVRTSTQNVRLRRDVESMRVLVGELMVLDPDQFAVVSLPQQWHEEHRWRVHLPDGGSYRLRLSTRDIAESGLPDNGRGKSAAALVEAGRHEVELKQAKLDPDRWRITVEIDGRTVFTTTESGDWHSKHGRFGMGSDTQTRQQPVGRPLVLFRRIFKLPRNQRRSPPGERKGNGLLLWFDSVVSGPSETPADSP